VAADTTGNWNPANGLSAGTLTINKATPVKDDYDTGYLTQRQPYPNNNNIFPVTVTVKEDGIRSPGGVTVYYEGTNGTTYTKSTAKPSYIGSYAVTFDVAASADGNWHSAAFSAGTLKINVFESIKDLKDWLEQQGTNDFTKPYPVALNVDDLGSAYNNPGSAGAMLIAIHDHGIFVSLDLSGSSFTSIEAYAFRDCGNLINVTISDNVISIGEGAFTSCGFLTSVIIGDHVQSIGNGAFYDIYNISVTFRKDDTSFGVEAFYDVNGLNALYSTGKAGTYKLINNTWTEVQ